MRDSSSYIDLSPRDLVAEIIHRTKIPKVEQRKNVREGQLDDKCETRRTPKIVNADSNIVFHNFRRNPDGTSWHASHVQYVYMCHPCLKTCWHESRIEQLDDIRRDSAALIQSSTLNCQLGPLLRWNEVGRVFRATSCTKLQVKSSLKATTTVRDYIFLYK